MFIKLPHRHELLYDFFIITTNNHKKNIEVA